ncbi:MBOAT family O-acyltransferase [Spirosoma spitsbergense]|uniref:MBOAT family O-acyltransferase n=1 Tax=Spirosoma spitsbergense TaxID=431554 RepID=UPI00037E7E4F|nr:MBOAT family O-acyltransferase [Spirosoma spitsbergense]
MLFNSLHFVFFFIVITTTYYLIPYRYRWLLLLIGSCYFYMAFVPVYIIILGFTIIVDYFSGLYIEKSSGKTRKLYLVTSIVANLSVLFIFKYYNFLNISFDTLLGNIGLTSNLPFLTILLPIGLSFHTFQAMSYTIEVYRNKQKAERHFGIYALYVMFYPQLVAGPIERPQNVLHQFYEKHSYKADNVAKGLKLMAWGMFKKVVIADRLAVIVNNVYDTPTNFKGMPLIVATILFAFQIYCDFSGYSDIAIGSAHTLGFRLMKNFESPYFSTSPSEFWKRWHISLSTWFRDYLYIPLGGNRVGTSRLYFNLLVTFFISGLWHGANWTYIIWGTLNGLYIILEIMSKTLRNSIKYKLGLNEFSGINRMMSITITFSLICVAWIFFRAKNLSDGYYILTHLFTNFAGSFQYLKPSYLGSTLYDYTVSLFALIVLFFVETVQRSTSINGVVKSWPLLYRVSLYYILVMIILLFGVFNVQEQFIYFQF